MRLEPVILNALTNDSKFSEKVRPHLNSDYFHDESEKLVFEIMEEFTAKYGKVPPRDSVVIELDSLDGIKEGVYKKATDVIESVYNDEYKYDTQWLIDQTESFCKEKAIYNAIMHSVKIINGDSQTENPAAIPSIMTKALSVAFDTNVGHDYFGSAETRWEHYHKKETRIKTRIDLMNKVTGGGLPLKTLFCAMGSCVHPDTKITVRLRKKT